MQMSYVNQTILIALSREDADACKKHPLNRAFLIPERLDIVEAGVENSSGFSIEDLYRQ